MAMKHQFTGMTGVYLVAAELSRRQFIVSPTSRSALTADLLISDPLCRNTYAVQVKTNAVTFSFWLVNSKTSSIISDQLVYVFVNLRKGRTEFYIVPNEVVKKVVIVSKPSATRTSVWYSVYLKDIAEYKDRWDLFQNAGMSDAIQSAASASDRADLENDESFDVADSKGQKPQLHILGWDEDPNSLVDFFKRITGKTPSKQEAERLREAWMELLTKREDSAEKQRNRRQ